MSQLLIDHASRARLATFLKPCDRPPEISLLTWLNLIDGSISSAPFKLIGSLCDAFGPDVILSVLNWPVRDGVTHAENVPAR